MKKNNINYKLLNVLIFTGIIYLLYQTKGLWNLIGNKLVSILFPFLIAFVIAYALHPYAKKLEEKKVPKALANGIVFLTLLTIIGFTIFTLMPLLFEQLGSLFNAILAFIKEISNQYDIDFGPLHKTLTDAFNDVITNFGKLISDGAFSVITTSMGYLSTTIIVLASSVYFLVDMDKIRTSIQDYYRKKSNKTYTYIRLLDESMKNYLEGFTKIIFITIIEYTFAFFIIGHPNAIMLGLLAAIANLIPYFGGLITNIIAAITAFVIGPKLFIRTLILFILLSMLDSYIINPFVYGKTNELHPIVIILSVFAGGILFGVVGIMISLPLTILIITTIKYYNKDMKNKITKFID